VKGTTVVPEDDMATDAALKIWYRRELARKESGWSVESEER
jgi:hypothetical protein